MKIYIVFMGKPKGKEGWPFADFDCEERKNYLLAKLKKENEDIKFAGEDLVTSIEEAEKVKGKIKDIDAVLIYLTTTSMGMDIAFGKILETGYPTLVINDIYGGDGVFLWTNTLARKRKLPVLPISSSRLEDVGDALRVIKTIYKLKRTKILLIEEPGSETALWRFAPADKYLKAVKDIFGLEVIIKSSKEVVEYYENIDEVASKRVAEEWIEKAVKVVEPSRNEVINSARLYLAIKKMMEDAGANAVTIDCLGLFHAGKLPAYPCLAYFQLCNDGYVGACEADLDSTISQLIGQYLFERPGFISDPVIDTYTSQVIYAHCVAPTRIFGKEGPFAPYRIRSHAEDGRGASIQAIMPPNHTITSIKVNALNKEMAIHQGRSVGNVDEERACRTKLAVEANARKILENWDFEKFMWHRVSFYGDFRKDVCDFAKLLNLKIVEEDK